MKKDNLRIKEIITIDDIRRVIESIVSSYFTGDEYTPYYCDMAKTMAIAVNFTDGISFDKDDDIWVLSKTDKDLSNVVDTILKNDYYKDMMEFIDKCVTDKVDFIKQSIIHSHRDMDKIIEFCDVVIDSFKNFANLNLKNVSDIDMESVRNIISEIQDKGITVENISDAIKNAVGFDIDSASAEIIDDLKLQLKEKDEQIKQLSEKKVAKISSKKKMVKTDE